LQHQVVGAVETFARITLGTETVLIADDDELEAGVAQLQHRRNHAPEQAQFFVGVDLEVFGLLDEGAVTIDEEDLRGHQGVPSATGLPAPRAGELVRAVSADNTRAFCSGVPMVMRNASPRPRAARWSRTTMPASSSARNAASASSSRSNRKFACEG